jgi:hypothetical protein
MAPDAAARACSPVGPGGSCCGFGRPFLVDREARLASTASRADWRRSAAKPDVGGLPASVRARLAQHWTETARMEHASIAAFARFVLQLLGLGAPPDLVDGAQRAIGDETEHARLAFGLASAYAGADIGPGPIAVDACLEGMDVRSVVATTFAEGCVGETLAALEAREALEAVGDRHPAVAAALGIIAADEERHARLAWRSVQWLLAAFGQAAREALEAALEEATAHEAGQRAPRIGDDDAVLAEHGVLSEGARATLRRAAIRRVVAPMARELVSTRPHARAAKRRESGRHVDSPHARAAKRRESGRHVD